MKAADIHLDHLKWGHDLLRQVVADVTPEQAHWKPPGVANPLAAVLAHAVIAEDHLVHRFFAGAEPLYEGAWKDRTGVSEPKSSMSQEWAQRLRVDLDSFKEYMEAVFESTEAATAQIPDEVFRADMDLSNAGLGTMRGSYAFAAIIASHTNNMIGEISCLKGLQGAKGYPW